MAENTSKPKSSHVAPTSVRQTHFRFRIWHGLILILLILVVGVVIIRFSKASGDSINSQAAKAITSSDIARYQAQFGSNSKPALPVTGQVNFTYKGKGNPKFVAYYVDDQLKATPVQTPYTYTLDTTALNNGQHTVVSIAYDSNDIVSNFISQKISVLNGGRLQMLVNGFSYPWKVILGDN